MVFQSFWTLTGNPALMATGIVKGLAGEVVKLGVEDAKVVSLYALVLGLEGITVLDGTTREGRMRGDLKGLEKVGVWAEGEGRSIWDAYLESFKKLIGETG